MSIHDMKAVIPVLYTNYRFNKDVTNEELGLSHEQFNVLVKLSKLLMETKFTNIASKIYMQNPKYTQRDVGIELGLSSTNSVKGRIRYDNQKLSNIYERDIYTAIISTTDLETLSKIDAILSTLINITPRLSRNAVDYLTVSLPDKPEVYSSLVTDSEFEKYKNLIYEISHRHAKEVIEELGDKGLGYIEYLLDADPINSLDIKRRRELLGLLK